MERRPRADRRRRWRRDCGPGRSARDPGLGPGARMRLARDAHLEAGLATPPVTRRCGPGPVPGSGRFREPGGGPKAVNQNGDFFWRRRRQDRGADAGRRARRGGPGAAGAAGKPARPLICAGQGRGRGRRGAARGRGRGCGGALTCGRPAGRGQGGGRARPGRAGRGRGAQGVRAAQAARRAGGHMRTPPLPPLTVLLLGEGGELSRYSCCSATGETGPGGGLFGHSLAPLPVRPLRGLGRQSKVAGDASFGPEAVFRHWGKLEAWWGAGCCPNPSAHGWKRLGISTT